MSKAKPIKHGTYGGSQVHRKRGEKVCEDCALAAREYMRALRVVRPEMYQRDNERRKGRRQSRDYWPQRARLMRGKCAPGLGWPVELRRA